MSEEIASSLSVSVTLDGWRRPDGKLWAERQAITLQAPSIYIDKKTKFIIAGLSLKLDPTNGRTVDLRLVPPEIYSAELTKKKKKKVDLW